MPDRSFIEWDKDDIDALGIFKIDVLALGMLTCVRKSLDLIWDHYGERYDLATVPREDPAVYDMLCAGDSLGVFQVESRAQMNMLPRLKPRCYYDLVIEVAIVRPGPIQGDMVHPYLKRRDKREAVEFPSPFPHEGPADELELILKRTLGVPIFQEQAMKIALDAAQFSPAEANQLRKAMATFRSRGTIETLQSRMVERMVDRGYDREFSQRCFDQIKGFGEYGFPESHAASFAHLVYISSWIKRHHPAAFACGLLNSQPMGFYAPAQIVRDAIEHGVEVRHPDVNYSDWDNRLEASLSSPAFAGEGDHPAKRDGGGVLQRQDSSLQNPSTTSWSPSQSSAWGGQSPRYALRLGLRQIDGLHFEAARALLAARDRPYADVEDLKARSGINVPAVRRLAAADAFRSMGLDRRQALWDSRTLRAAPDLPLFAFADQRSEGAEEEVVRLPETPLSEHVVSDYQTLRLSLKAHPLSFLRPALAAKGYTRASDLRSCKFGQPVRVSGIVLIRQKPGTAKGVCFITLEDETGVCNLVIWPDTMKKYRRTVMSARLMAVRGTVQMDDAVIHVIAHEIFDRSEDLALLSADAFRSDLARADHVVSPLPHTTHRHPRDVEVIPKSRDFH
jgi:error-prone DNA polymerase